jgi:hypothetical protein
VLVVVVSIAVLLVLARFRFPSAAMNVTPPSPSPLAGLVGRADFEDLADSMSTLLGRVTPRLFIVRFEPIREPVASRGSSRPSEPPRAAATPDPIDPGPPPVLGAALRVRGDLALVHVPAGMYPAALIGSANPAEVVAANPRRAIALVRVAPADYRPEPLTDAFLGFEYVGKIEPTLSGPSVEPVFIGRSDSILDDRWPATLFSIGHAPGLPAGTLVFSIGGRLIGLVERDSHGATLVPSSVLESAVAELVPAGAIAP